MPYCPLAPVADAVYAVLATDATLEGLAPGGVFAEVPPDPSYPFVWIECSEDQQHGGMGTKPGVGALPEIDLRVHVFQSDYGTLREAQIVMSRVIALLADPPAVEGYINSVIFHDRTIPLADEELNGVRVKELVSMHRWFVEEVAA